MELCWAMKNDSGHCYSKLDIPSTKQVFFSVVHSSRQSVLITPPDDRYLSSRECSSLADIDGADDLCFKSPEREMLNGVAVMPSMCLSRVYGQTWLLEQQNLSLIQEVGFP